MDLTAYRSEFPALRDQVYLNHAAVAPTSLRVAAAVSKWMDDLVQNGLRHEDAWEATAERARARAARIVGANPTDIAFVRNTSHGLGLIAEGLEWAPGDEVAVATSVEFPSNVYVWRHLESRGVVVREIEAHGGGVTVEGVRAAITARTRLVAVSSVQYATGAATDLDAVGALCAEAGVLFCVDAIQSVGCVPVDVKRSRVHFLAADSHKWMLGINGIGFLYVDPAWVERVRPALVGWKSTTDAWNFDRVHFELRRDALRFEEGSPAYTGIYALDAALELLEEVTIPAIHARVTQLLSSLEEGLINAGCDVAPAARASGTSGTSGPRAGILMASLRAATASDRDREGDMARLHADLLEHRIKVSLRRGRLRISPHFYTTDEEIAMLVARVGAFR